ncbi:hypothetical protein Ami103574_04345 [Aminipila butyrica]|uniref:Uncharacterized protein n=1 Tax=Aminipila butyrica TaxID=433296 RepID=A0A858BSP3_9FIRM|nr:hypothetical protein [Aminipila butyrica]QIB68597.1 hypothetical protein Ami103574_04345 [Aminipila butyrica]
MSNRNRRIKPIEAALRKEIEAIDTELLDLQEENSNLRRLLDEQNDYIKQELKGLRKALVDHYRYQEYLKNRLEDESAIRRQKDNQLRAAIAGIPEPRRLIKFLFK